MTSIVSSTSEELVCDPASSIVSSTSEELIFDPVYIPKSPKAKVLDHIYPKGPFFFETPYVEDLPNNKTDLLSKNITKICEQCKYEGRKFDYYASDEILGRGGKYSLSKPILCGTISMSHKSDFDDLEKFYLAKAIFEIKHSWIEERLPRAIAWLAIFILYFVGSLFLTTMLTNYVLIPSLFFGLYAVCTYPKRAAHEAIYSSDLEVARAIGFETSTNALIRLQQTGIDNTWNSYFTWSPTLQARIEYLHQEFEKYVN